MPVKLSSINQNKLAANLVDHLPSAIFVYSGSWQLRWVGVNSRSNSYETFMCKNPGRFGPVLLSCLPYLAVATKTYIGSVLFRTSTYTGTKQASRIPAGSKQDKSPHNDDVKDVSVLLESELIRPVKEDR